MKISSLPCAEPRSVFHGPARSTPGRLHSLWRRPSSLLAVLPRCISHPVQRYLLEALFESSYAFVYTLHRRRSFGWRPRAARPFRYYAPKCPVG